MSLGMRIHVGVLNSNTGADISEVAVPQATMLVALELKGLHCKL